MDKQSMKLHANLVNSERCPKVEGDNRKCTRNTY